VNSRPHLLALVALTLGGSISIGCADRDPVWDTTMNAPDEAYGLEGSVALIDAAADRLLALPVDGELSLAPRSIAIGEGFTKAVATADGKRFVAVSRGKSPRREAKDPGPSVVVIGGGTEPAIERRFDLTDPLSGIAIDPASSLAVLYSSGDDSAFVENPNELVVVDLAQNQAADNPKPRTLRSFGGQPETLTFTPELELPGGKTRLLVVGTDRDVSLLDLQRLDQPEITVRLTGGAEVVRPTGFAVTDGAMDRADDARIAVRVASEPSVYLVDLLPQLTDDATTAPQPYRAVPNVVYVGGPVTDLAFVQTDGGPRLAAVVPSRAALVLIDPVTALTAEVPLGAPFTRLSLVTDIVGQGAGGSDVALLWSGSAPSAAFVALGATIGKPYKSVESLKLPAPVESVIDVPAPNRHLKILRTTDARSFVVLDLTTRTASPLVASALGGTELRVAPDGERAWLFSRGSSQLAEVGLTTLHPRNLTLSYPIADVFDIARQDGGRALVALHTASAGAVTVLDARTPSLTTAREYTGVLLGDLR
jgi:hypothetical protein